MVDYNPPPLPENHVYLYQSILTTDHFRQFCNKKRACVDLAGSLLFKFPLRSIWSLHFGSPSFSFLLRMPPSLLYMIALLAGGRR